MKKKFIATISVILGIILMFHSCIGSFNLTNRLYDWNKSTDDQWVNELIFVALFTAQVYTVALFLDGVVFNSIEFWTGENPTNLTKTQIKHVETSNGIYTIISNANGHKIQEKGEKETVEFLFNWEEKTWKLKMKEQIIPLVHFISGHQAAIYLADGKILTVNKSYFAKK